jgi:hypothetical protein
MGERTYLMTVEIVFLFFTVEHILSIILMPLIAPPVWVCIVAGVVTGFLACEGFHFAGKSRPKG